MSSSSTSKLPGSQGPEYIPLQRLGPGGPIRVRKRKREARQLEQAHSSTKSYDGCDYSVVDHPIEGQPLGRKSSTFNALLRFKFPERKRHKSDITREMPGPEGSSHPEGAVQSSRNRVVTVGDDWTRHDSASAALEERRRRSTFGSFVSGVRKSFSAVSRRRKASSHEQPPVPLLPVRPHSAIVHGQPHFCGPDHHGALPSNNTGAGSSTSWPSASVLNLDLVTQYMGRISAGVPTGAFDGTRLSPSRSPSPEPASPLMPTPRTNAEAGAAPQLWNRLRGWSPRGVPSARPSGRDAALPSEIDATGTPSRARPAANRRTPNFLFLSRSPRAQVQPSIAPGLTNPFSRTPRNRNSPSQRSPLSPFKNGPFSPFRNSFRRGTRAFSAQPSPAQSEAISISDPNLFGPMPNLDFQFSFTPDFGNPRELERRHSVSSPQRIGVLPDTDTDSRPNSQTRSAGDIPHVVFSETPSSADNGNINSSNDTDITTHDINTNTNSPNASDADPSLSTTPPGFPPNPPYTPIPGLQISRLRRPPPRLIFEPPPPYIYPPTFIETLAEAVADVVPQPTPSRTPAAEHDPEHDPEPGTPFYTPPTRPSGPTPGDILKPTHRSQTELHREQIENHDIDSDADTDPFLVPSSPLRYRHYYSRTRVEHLNVHGNAINIHTHMNLGLDFDRMPVLSPSTRRSRAYRDEVLAAPVAMRGYGMQLQTHGLLDDEDDNMALDMSGRPLRLLPHLRIDPSAPVRETENENENENRNRSEGSFSNLNPNDHDFRRGWMWGRRERRNPHPDPEQINREWAQERARETEREQEESGMRDRGVSGDMTSLVSTLDEVIEDGGRIRSSWDMGGLDADTNTNTSAGVIRLVDGYADIEMIEGGGSSQEEGDGEARRVDVGAGMEDEETEAGDEHEMGLDGDDEDADADDEDEDSMLWGSARGRTLMCRSSLEMLRRMVE